MPRTAWLKKLGPGFITGASDDDPSGIATYTQVGASFGLGMLWAAVITLPFMIAVQEMAGRIGMVAGQGLGAVLRKHYPAWLLWLFLSLIVLANTFNIGADLGAMADAAHLLVPSLPFGLFIVAFACLILVLEIFITYRAYANILKWLTLSLLSYVLTAFIVVGDWGSVLKSAIVPSLEMNRAYLLGLVALLGTTISPYLFIWQSQEEVEEEIAEGRSRLAQRKGATAAELRTMRFDTVFGMSFSQLITFFIIVTAAMAFFRHGLYSIQTSAEAARALFPLAGRFAAWLYAAGIIGTGLLAVPVLSASASYVLSEALGWSDGLYKKFRQAHGFYGVITLSTLIGLCLNFTSLSPLKALFYAAVLNGLVTPIMIAVMLKIANNPKIMGQRANGAWSNTFCGLTMLAMAAAGILIFVL